MCRSNSHRRSAAFETEVAELAERLAGLSDAKADSAEPESSEDPKSDSPMALRSALDPQDKGARPPGEDASRRSFDIDTFDVIELSLPGNAADPWDRASADALTGLYEFWRREPRAEAGIRRIRRRRYAQFQRFKHVFCNRSEMAREPFRRNCQGNRAGACRHPPGSRLLRNWSAARSIRGAFHKVVRRRGDAG